MPVLQSTPIEPKKYVFVEKKEFDQMKRSIEDLQKKPEEVLASEYPWRLAMGFQIVFSIALIALVACDGDARIVIAIIVIMQAAVHSCLDFYKGKEKPLRSVLARVINVGATIASLGLVLAQTPVLSTSK
jgi:hypothetical protein